MKLARSLRSPQPRLRTSVPCVGRLCGAPQCFAPFSVEKRGISCREEAAARAVEGVQAATVLETVECRNYLGTGSSIRPRLMKTNGAVGGWGCAFPPRQRQPSFLNGDVRLSLLGWWLGGRNRNGCECLFLRFHLKVNCRAGGKSEATPSRQIPFEPRYWGKDQKLPLI